MLKPVIVSIVSTALVVVANSAPARTSSNAFGASSSNSMRNGFQNNTAPSSEFQPDQFEAEIRPLLVKFCIECHDGADFLEAKNSTDVSGIRDAYASVVEQMENRWMPPKDFDQPTEAERKLINDWLRDTLDFEPGYFDRLARYVVETYEDKNGNLWLGTMHKGAARYDGKTLTWFNKEDGLASNAVPSFAEDKDGNLLVGTQEGVSRFDPSVEPGEKAFEPFGSEQGLPPHYGRVRADRDGNIWAGMNTGVFRFDGSSFTEFKVPIDKEKIESYAIIPGQVSMALHDSKGNLWFSTDGYGAFKYDGTSFIHYTKDDGLCSNNVTGILEDQQGRIWFTCIQSFQPEATGDGGVCRYDGKTFTKFPDVKGLNENDIYTIHETNAGDIWIGATHVGVYRFDGDSFTLFNKSDRNHWTRNFGLQGMLEDQDGTLWFGFSGGLFQFNGQSFVNVPHLGPPAERSVEALLKRLQSSSIVVDGDPIEKTTITELLAEHHTPGVSIAVIRDGKIDWARGFGVADVESGRAVTSETLFQAASISKPVAAAAALSMVEDGLLDLDEDVNLKLKSWKVPSNEFTEQQPVTLRQLLSHTAGTTVHGFPGYARDKELPGKIDILDGRGNTAPVRVDTLPGSNWRYSGGGYTIMGQLMVDVADKPYPEILRERVLEPAGMKSSTFVQPLPSERENDAATAYAQDGTAIEGRFHNYPEIGAAGLWTTAEDLARFALAIQESRAGKPGSLLSSSMVDEMLTPVMNYYGLGFGISADGKRFGHGGANAGYRSRLSASLDDGWGIVVLTNGDRGSALCELVPIAAAKAYRWPAYQPTVRKRVDIGEDALARIAGTYEILPESANVRARFALFPNMGTIELKATNGRLIADVPEGAGTEGRVEFLPQSEYQVQERRTGRLMDFTVEDGQVTGFKFREFEAKRVEK